MQCAMEHRTTKSRAQYELTSVLQEFSKHHEQPDKYIKQYVGVHPKTGREFTVDVGYERFLGPEVFFNPELYSASYTTPLPTVSNPVLVAVSAYWCVAC